MRFAKKSLGQNFLIDKNIIKKIVNLVNVKNRNIIEIGPGNGALTDEILKRNPSSISIIEKDYNLYEKLKNKYSDNNIIKIFNDDVLKFNIKKIIKKKSIIFGNLPYNISSQILVKMLRLKNKSSKFDNIIFMFQKELGDKIIGRYSTPNYSRLSILTNFKFIVDKKFLVSANCFFPRPKVTSMVIHFKPKNMISYKIQNLESLEKVTNILFSNKRKIIKKNLTKIISKNEIHKIGNIQLTQRPSELKPEIYYRITELFERK